MKKVFIGGVVVVLALGGFVFLTLSNLGPLIKKAVNTAGPQITKTDVEVADVSISIFSGEAKIKGFVLGNPKGFTSARAMKVGAVYLDIDEGSITQNPLVINKIEIVAPEITYEKIAGSDNFQALLNNIQGNAKKEKKSSGTSPSGGDTPAKKIVIHEVIVKDGRVTLTMAALGKKEITAPLPDIHLKGIGKKKNGATPAQAFEQIFSALYSSISANSVTQVFNDGIKQLGSLKTLGTSTLQSVESTAGKAAESATDSVKSATQGLKSLFKKDE